MSRFSEPARDRVQVYLSPGQVFASRDACEVTTILGSCVSVLLFDAARGVGGANHYLLPLDAQGARGLDETSRARFGDAAIAQLLERVLSLGSRKADLVAKVFGGASTLVAHRGLGPTLGSQNVEVARRCLERASIPIVAEDVGGTSGRKLVFATDEGHVWVKRL